ncbi:metal ABC transporter substrate-binding protein [Nodularia sp. NIES-3585]|uniref:metal ABC transporter substrate-binding protein n=1 Tax=Nodularia sp. NIES-3585 TaxID=1973477 RepID=UPI000B5C3815|nr:metal ABC transporter substrate-binding protein [Nodularia sp. NIES-3585]GAX37986.1 periplasmic solute binding protein for ABC transport system [Nodularia sp. NIES-3585]
MIWNRLAQKTGKKTSRVLPLIALLTLSVAFGCNQSNTDIGETSEQTTQVQETAATPAATEKVKVVATILPTYLFTKAVAGDVADVAILVPPTTDVHDYQSTPDDVKTISTASILVKNGLGLEEFLDSTIKNAENPNLVKIDASKGIKTLDEISPVDETLTEHGHSHGHGHDHADGNPHVWLDPVLAKQQVTNIRDGLSAADPANKATYQANAAAYIQELDNLDQEFQQTLQKTPNCTFITFHDAFPYLAQRYNLKQVAVVQLPEDQLSPAEVQRAVKAVKQYNAKALFSEPGVDNKLLTSLGQDLNVTVRNLDSLETAGGDTNPQYYFQAMKTNLQTLEAGCK